MRPVNRFQERVLKIASNSLKTNQIPSFVLIGEEGIGKTFVAKWLSSIFSKRRAIDGYKYLLLYDLEEKETLNSLKGEITPQTLVIIDEVREPFFTPKTKTHLEYLISYFYENKIPFILIFNEKEDVLKLTRPTLSKLKEVAYFVEGKSQNYRDNPRFLNAKKKKKNEEF
jgi:DNA replication protein DnaC